ncbi:hypothetical protein RZS08_52220, partial [Arthrospira platensis SPKY1]|nr:hypothetical protein [Arthrospira platensis SPKY1]
LVQRCADGIACPQRGSGQACRAGQRCRQHRGARRHRLEKAHHPARLGRQRHQPAGRTARTGGKPGQGPDQPNPLLDHHQPEQRLDRGQQAIEPAGQQVELRCSATDVTGE